MSMTVWGYAKAQYPHEQLFAAIETAAIPLIDNGTMQDFDVSNIAWAFSKLNFMTPALYKSIAKRATSCAGRLQPQVILFF